MILQRDIDTDAIKQRVDLRELLGLRAVLHAETSGGREQSGPCPKCGGADRLHVTADWFMCRQCHPKRGDAIEAVQWLGLAADFRAACAYLGGSSAPAASVARTIPASRPKPQTWQDAAWQAEASFTLAAAQRNLASTTGGPGRDYLLDRGILRGTWEAWGLGYKSDAFDGKLQVKRPAIVIPWRKDGQLTAIKYRFLTVPDGGLRYTSKAGSGFFVFGLGARPERLDVLWLLEGELNALALWQTLTVYHWPGGDRSGWEVASFGGQSKVTALPEELITLAGQYSHVIVWADDPAKTAEAMGKIPGALGLRSPDRGGKMDAAELGRAFLLAEFVDAVESKLGVKPSYR